jgi:hypothetical protein
VTKRLARALLPAAAALLFTACSSQPVHKTDPKAAMAAITLDPSKCESVGASSYTCNSEHADPKQARALQQAGSTNDARLIRGSCADGYQYDQALGCVPGD